MDKHLNIDITVNVRVALDGMCVELANRITEIVTALNHMEYIGMAGTSGMKESYDLLENRRLVQSFLHRVLFTDLSDNMDMRVHHGKDNRSVIEIAFKEFPTEKIRHVILTRHYERCGPGEIELMVRKLVNNRLAVMDSDNKEKPKQSHASRDLDWFNNVVSKHDGSEVDLFVNTKVYYAKLFFKIVSKVSSMSDFLAVPFGSAVRPDLIHAVDVMSSLQRTLANDSTYVGDWEVAMKEYLNRGKKTMGKKQVDDLEQRFSALQKEVDDFKKHLEEISNKQRSV